MSFDKAKAVRAAEKYLAQGKIPSAIQEYQRITANDAEDFTALNTLGDLHARINQKQEAVVCYRHVAEHYREQGFALKAVAMYKKVTRIDACDPLVALALAELYEQQGLMTDAHAQYLAAADFFTRAGAGRDALEALRRIADLDPADTAVRLRLAEGYAAEGMADEAAESYTSAGERLAARGDHRRALEVFNKALGLRPGLHVALSGALGAHVALGTPGEAAETLEQSVAEKPRDVELHAMLARAYIEAEDARRADRATEDLVRLDVASYTVFFDVVRLYLQHGNVKESARVLGRISEQALAGHQDETLLELLQEVLARDPEQLAALRLLVRVYAWQREDERLRMALERLADAAQTAGDAEEERNALGQLVRLAPDEPRYSSRLESLGGHPDGADAPADSYGDEVPTFESFMLHDEAPAEADAGGRGAATAAAANAGAAEFEWNTAGEAQPQAAPAEAFAFERNEADASGGEVVYDFSAPGGPSAAAGAGNAQSSGFQEFDFGAESGETARTGDAPSAERMLLQELESVDFYIEQGYADIARETLDMLERQYGPHAELDRRRATLPTDDFSGAPAAAPADNEAEFDSPTAFDFTTLAPPASADEAGDSGGDYDPFAEGVADGFAFGPASEPAAPAAGAETGAAAEIAAPPAEIIAAPAAPAAAGLDPGLAAIFDEFRESVEDEEPERNEDYETHYQMGLAYREMGLLDQAIEEFQLASGLASAGDGTPRYLHCCNLLGHCFIQKGMPRPAAVWFRKGLDAPGHTEDEYQALRYELAAAFEQMGDIGRAVEIFSEVYAIDVTYRGVAERLRNLQSLKQ